MSQLQAPTLKFLRQLAANNNKPWFDAHRDEYESAKADFLNFSSQLIKGLAGFDSDLAGIEPKKTIFRINRDIRFSKDKSPYKTNFGTSINKGGKKIMTAGYYFQLEPGNKSFAALGSYQPEPPSLAAIRQEIDYHYKEFNSILKAATFKKHFDGLDEIEKLKTAPKGYQPDNPAIDLIKHKHFIVSKSYTDKEVLAPGFIKELVSCMKAGSPLVKFLNRAIS